MNPVPAKPPVAKPAQEVPDFFPEVTEYKLDPKVTQILKQNGRNPITMQRDLDSAIGSKDYVRKAQLLNEAASLTDHIYGNSGATNWLNARRINLQPAEQGGSVSKTQALLGLTGNGFIDLAESLPKLAVAAYEKVVKGGKDTREWERANKSIENFFEGARTYVSDDYQQGLASYSDENGVDFHLDAKNFVGTVGSLASYILPGMISAGAGSVASLSARAGLRGAATAAEVALNSAKLGRIGRNVTIATGAESMLHMFPMYQKEALEAGLTINQATNFALLVSPINGLIETANMGALTKALGLTDDVAKAAIRAVGVQEVRSTLQNMAGKELTQEMFMDAAKQTSKNILGVISRPKSMGVLANMAKNSGRRVLTGLTEQGLTEGGEEYLQGTVEQVAKLIHNNYGASKGLLGEDGRFKDTSLGNYVFNSVYGTFLGVLAGTTMGTFIQKGDANPTIFGQINADVRLQLNKGRALEEIMPRLKMSQQVQALYDGQQISEPQYQNLMGTVTRMAETAADFADVDGFTDSDRYVMFKISTSRTEAETDSSSIAQTKQEYNDVLSQLADPSLSQGNRLKGELKKNDLLKVLGGEALDENGAPEPDMFQAEQFVQKRAEALDNISNQVMELYATDTDRNKIKDFFNNNYTTWQKAYGKLNQYADPFKPTNVVVDPSTQTSVAFDESRRYFRVMKPTGGAVTSLPSINENGNYIPAVREPMGYDYNQAVEDINEHIRLSDAVADPASELSQSVEPYEGPDNSPQRNWIRDGEDILRSYAQESESGSKKKKTANLDKLAEAYLNSSQAIAADAQYGPMYTDVSTRLREAMKSSSSSSTGSGKADTTTATSGVPTVHTAKLDQTLAKSRPRYGFGDVNFAINFVSDVDRALYITSQKLPSKRDGDFRRFLSQLGYTNTEIGREGQNVRNSLKQEAQKSVLAGATSGSLLRIMSPVAAEPASPASKVTAEPTIFDSTNGQESVADNSANVGETNAQSSDPGAEYTAEHERAESIDVALQIEEELDQLIRSAGTTGIPDVGTVEQLVALIEQAINARAEATGINGEESSEKSVDEADIPTDAVGLQGAVEVTLPSGPVSMQDVLTALSDATSPEIAAQFEAEVLDLLRHPKFLQDSLLFYQLPAERKTPGGKPSNKRRPNTDRRMRMPVAWFRGGGEVLAGQRAEQTSPAADEMIRKFLTIFLEGGVEIDDKTTGQRATLSLGELAGQAAMMEETLPDGSEEIDPVAYFAAEELLEELTDDDIEAMLSIIDEVKDASDQNWLAALSDRLETAFPPMNPQLQDSINQIVADYLDVREAAIFDNADESDPEYQRAINEYESINKALRISVSQYEGRSDIGTGTNDPGENAASETGSVPASDSDESSQPNLGQIVDATVNEALTRINEAERVVGVAPEATGSGQTEDTFEPAIAALESEVEVQSAEPLIPEPVFAVPADEVTDDIYRGFRENPQNYELPKSLIDAIAYRISTQTATTRDIAIQRLREDEFKVAVREANQQRTEYSRQQKLYAEQQERLNRIDTTLRDVESALNTAATEDPRTASAVVEQDVALANLRIQGEVGEYDETRQEILQQKLDIVDDTIEALETPAEPVAANSEEATITNRLDDKLRSMRSGLNSNPFADPELIGLATEYFGFKIRQGISKFAEIVRDFARTVSDQFTPDKLRSLGGLYNLFRRTQPVQIAQDLDNPIEVRNTAMPVVEAPLQETVVSIPVVSPQLAKTLSRDLESTNELASQLPGLPGIQEAIQLAQNEVAIANQIEPVSEANQTIADSLSDQIATIGDVMDTVYESEGESANDVLQEGTYSTENAYRKSLIYLGTRLAASLAWPASSMRISSFMSMTHGAGTVTLQNGANVVVVQSFVSKNNITDEVELQDYVQVRLQGRGEAIDTNIQATPAELASQINAVLEDSTGTGAETLPVEAAVNEMVNPGVEETVPSRDPLLTVAAQFAQSLPSTNVIADPVAYEAALVESGAAELLGERRPLSFEWNGNVYLSPDATERSVIHEFGHVWADVAEVNQPDLFATGAALVADSPYMAAVKADPYYSTLAENLQVKEAMARAIEDKGVMTQDTPAKNAIQNWLSSLWSAIKDFLGLQSEVPADTSLSDFVAQVLAQLRGTENLEPTQLGDTLSESSSDQVAARPQFQLPAWVKTSSIADFRASAEDQLQNIPALSIGSGVSPTLWDDPVSSWTDADKTYVKNLKKETGWELVAPQTVSWTRPGDFFHTADGKALRYEGFQIGQTIREGFQNLYDDQSNRGTMFRTIFDFLKPWVNLETFIDFIDTTEGIFNTLLKDVKRVATRRASFAQVMLEPLRRDAERKLVDFSLRAGNTMETVKTMTVTSYDYDDNGTVVQRDILLPVAVGMELVLLADTQIETYGETSHVVAGMPQATELFRENRDQTGQVVRTRYNKGAIYYDEASDQTVNVIIDEADLATLRDRFENGNGAFSGEQEAFASLKTYYNQKEVVDLLAEENDYLNPNSPFERVQDYYPIRTAGGRQDARQASRGFSRTLNESRQLIARQSASEGVVLRDPIVTMGDYQNSIQDILENGRLVDNINSLINGIATDYDGPKKRQLQSYLEQRRDDLQDHRKRRADAFERRGFIRFIETGMRKFTQSTFALNVGLPLKQTGTYAAALGQGIIKDEFLKSGEATGTLALLTASAYKDWEAPSTIDNTTGEGYKGSITDADTQERPYMEELFGNGLPDDLAKMRQLKRFATIIDRLTASQTLYTGDVEFDSLGLNQKTLDQAQKKLRAFDEWTSEYGLGAMKRADRAVILSYYTAAKLQAASEGLSPTDTDAAKVDAYWDRVADLTERTVYATNQMSQLSEQTPLQSSTDFVAKILGLYSGQQQKLLNTLFQSFNTWAKTGQGTDEAKAALLRFGQTFGWSILFNAAWVSAISAGASALMAILSGRDPRSWDEMVDRTKWDFANNVIGSVPSLGSQAVQFWFSQFDDRPGTDPLLQIAAAENIQTGLEIISGTAVYLVEEDDEKREKKLDSVLYDVKDFVPKATGIPSSVARIIYGNLIEKKD